MSRSSSDAEIYAGLRQLAAAAFPKRCSGCGREYASAADFIASTRGLHPDHSGLKHSLDDDDQPIVELFRNCECGSTLMESFNDRRDPSPAGIARRQRFEAMLDKLSARGMPRALARAELRKWLHSPVAELPPGIKAVMDHEVPPAVAGNTVTLPASN